SQVLAPILDYDEGRSAGDDDYDNGGGPSGERRRRGYRVPPPYVNAWRDHPLGRRAETHDPLKAQPPPPSRKNRETTTPMETGYEGDREDNGNLQGADQNSRLRPNARPQPPQQSPRLPPLRRRNTVAGDMIMSAPSVKRRVHHGVQTTLADDAKIDWDQVRKMGRKGGQRAQLSHGRRKSGGPGQHQHQHQQPVYGTRISEGHANYMLMYNMLTGIRISVSRCSAKPARQVVQEDYLAAHKYSFDIVGDELTPITRYDFKFKDYAPWVFRHIREAFHLDSSDYLMSLTDKYILSEVGSSGKSGSFFYYSQDFRFIIKTVRHTEHKFMRKILPQYYEYVRDNPNTMLSRIYGLHRIKLPEGRK
ncbi:Phosphatidylinositol-4-phosphate 5-kinase, partial [Spiromyces aspiralis]